MSLLLDALRRSQNKGQAKGAPAESAELPAAQEPVEPPFSPTVVAPVDAPTAPAAPAAHQALELTLDPIEPSPPESVSASSTLVGGLSDLPELPEAPALTEAPGLIDQSVSMAATERAEPLGELVQTDHAAPEVVAITELAPPAPEVVSAAPAPAPAAAPAAPAPLSVATHRSEPIDVPRPRPAVSAQETAQAMFNTASTSAPASPPQRDGSRARRLQWSLVIGLTLAALTWMAWQYWLSTQTPGLTPAGGAQTAPVMIQDEAPVAPPAEESASQAPLSTPAQASATQVTAPVAPTQTESPVRAVAPQRDATHAAVNGVAPQSKSASSVTSPSRQGDAGVRPAQLVRSQAQQQLQSAWAALREGDSARAQALYQQVLAGRPNDPDAALGLAVSLHRQRQLQAAWDAYQRSLQLWPDNETARTGMLAILSESDPDTAESRLQEWVQSRPRDAAAQAALGNLLGKQGRWAQALGPLTLAQSLAPNSAPHAYNLAVALDQARRYEEALQMYRLTQRLGSAGVPEQALQSRIQELQGASAR